MCLLLPIGNIGLQQFVSGIRLFQTLGRQDFNSLRQQNSGFSLHHDLVLQVFNRLDLFIQLQLQTSQGLA